VCVEAGSSGQQGRGALEVRGGGGSKCAHPCGEHVGTPWVQGTAQYAPGSEGSPLLLLFEQWHALAREA